MVLKKSHGKILSEQKLMASDFCQIMGKLVRLLRERSNFVDMVADHRELLLLECWESIDEESLTFSVSLQPKTFQGSADGCEMQ